MLSIAAGILHLHYLRNLVQYDGMALAEATAVAESRGEHERDLYHAEARPCVFHAYNMESGDPEVGLHSMRICSLCRAKLEERNVPEPCIEAIEAILAHVRRPTFAKSFLSILEHPMLSLVFGILVGGLLVDLIGSVIANTYTQSQPAIISLLLFLTVLFICAKYVWDLIRARA